MLLIFRLPDSARNARLNKTCHVSCIYPPTQTLKSARFAAQLSRHFEPTAQAGSESSKRLPLEYRRPNRSHPKHRFFLFFSEPALEIVHTEIPRCRWRSISDSHAIFNSFFIFFYHVTGCPSGDQGFSTPDPRLFILTRTCASPRLSGF